MLFSPALLDRNLDDDRPHLGPGLVWMPAENRWRLAALARRVVRYRSTETIERGIATTREILRATVELARARGAAPLIVVPQFLPELPRERELRRRILDETGLPYVWVPLDPSWRVWDDGHPNAQGAQAMARAIADRLQKRP
jgi:lysophospholipase L1-like esterase